MQVDLKVKRAYISFWWHAGLLQSFSLLQDHIQLQLHPMINRYIKPSPCPAFFSCSVICFPQMYVTIQKKRSQLEVFFHPQVNAQVLVSSFSPDSHQWILLGESMGRVLKACTASKEAYSRVHVTALGRWNNSIRARLLLCSRVTLYWMVIVLLFWELFCY